ncbi:MAG: FtsX-like permease family protein [Candidatus Cloacimonetes bacterium]|nr:FtsX-like permease family protein [Candidatus Cloacimonadota bacterium]MCF7814847.1 FtsX-like permease family protein [Candidatus Cloacimonadota bacterium]MCF7867903.1 FtsX-like permease family protein [Candidatus Cloacimonadota bacterium]MCF7883722.1 FtsX-like permease family protein [Candidatus Cloacimonadota bacterium]
MIFKLAYKNIIGAGLRTWLNIFILSVAYFSIIALQGFFVGWSEDATREIKDWHIASGQFWQQTYDPYDPFTLDESHAEIPAELNKQIVGGNAVPILLSPASIYPKGRMKSILLKGIDPNQKLLKIPTEFLNNDTEELGAIIGSRTAKSAELNVGDFVTLRWRDANGAWDATDVKINHIFETTVLAIDTNTLWIPLAKMQQMLELDNEATKIVMKYVPENLNYRNWEFKDEAFLLQDLKNMIQAKTVGSSIMYLLLLFMAGIAIFDTQILSIFRRRKEMGTMMALGMTRKKIIGLFTLEGSLHAVLAIFVGAVYGIPLLSYFEKVGLNFGASGDDYGISGLTDTLYPQYGVKLVLGTIILVLITVTIVSYLPSRKIARLKPTDALRGKMTK